MAMAEIEPEVSSIVDSIILAFANGMDIFRRMGRRKQKKKISSHKTITDDESRLRESLTNRPQEIRLQYNQSVAKFGRQFEVGDCSSQAHLAHTLLILNTGLIKLLNHALSNDSKQRSMTRKSLLCLSETAATDTLNTLSELSTRLTVPLQLTLTPSVQQAKRDERSLKLGSDRNTSGKDVVSSARRPPLTPLLARGGWVRTKSGSSIVSVSPTSKSHTSRNSQHKRNKSVPILDGDAQIPPNKSISPLPTKLMADTEKCVCHHAPDRTESKSNARDFTNISEEHDLIKKRAPSMLIVPADFFETYHQQQIWDEKHVPLSQSQDSMVPPRPPKIPLHVRPVIYTHSNMSSAAMSRQRPLSTATFLTTSTKIGEIPEHRLPDRILSEEEQARIPMPYTIPPPLEPPRPRGRGFRLWKRLLVA